MKIAILAQYPVHLLRDFSGAAFGGGHYATWLPQLSEEFGRQAGDLEIHWLTVTPLVKEAKILRQDNQTFHLLPTAGAKRALTFYREDRRLIRETLARIGPALVHAWGTEDVYGLAGTMSGYPCILSMQGILSHYALHTRMHPREYLQAVLELFCLHRAALVTTESGWGQKVILRRAPQARTALVEYGVQHHFFAVKRKPDPVRPVAIFVGTVVPRKGVQDAVAAMRALGNTSAELWIVGDSSGAWAEELRRNAPSNVKWLGKKSSQETAELLSRAWCLVLPTRGDTSPNVVKEARVVGLPIITTTEGGQTQYVEEGKDGYFVRPRDLKNLAACLKNVLGDFNQATAMGLRNIDRYRAALSPQMTAAKFLEIYRAGPAGLVSR